MSRDTGPSAEGETAAAVIQPVRCDDARQVGPWRSAVEKERRKDSRR